jgi:hypothetical protein
MTMRKKFSANPPKPAQPVAPRTAADNVRSFDMRPKPADDKRRSDPRDRAIRPSDTPEKLLDADPGE